MAERSPPNGRHEDEVEAGRIPFLSALAGLADSVTITTVGDDPRVVWANAAFERLTGYRVEEAIGRNPRFLQGPNTDRAVIARLKADLAAGREFRGTTANYRKDGGEYQVEWRITGARDEAGRVVHWVAVQRDVTDRWLLQRELEAARDGLEARVAARTAALSAANADLVRANAELDAFCQTVGHDFRGPIRNLVLRSRMVGEELGEAAGPEAQEHLRGIARGAKRLADLADDLLEHARLAKREVVRARVDVTRMARRVADEVLCEREIGGACVEVEDGLVAEADPRLLDLVLRNPIENSCKYAQGPVRVSVGREATEAGEALFVRDGGMGFDMAHAGRPFEPFERLHGKGDVEGTGIGLANVRRIVERHGGRVWAHAEAGRGATFWFTLG